VYVSKYIKFLDTELILTNLIGGGYSSKTYGARPSKHPPNLTKNERIRFVRCYYQFWGILKLDPSEQQLRLDSIPLRQLFYLSEMGKYVCGWLGAKVLSYPWFPNAEENSHHATYLGQPVERSSLSERIDETIKGIYYRNHTTQPEMTWYYGMDEGYLFFAAMWDHWQDTLKGHVCRTERVDPIIGRIPGRKMHGHFYLAKAYLWDVSSDEDGGSDEEE
jgi:hypothetical protein